MVAPIDECDGSPDDDAAEHLALGRLGEDLAAEFLSAQGYQIIFRNYCCAGGEVDLIALDAGTLCFIEVRSLGSDRYGDPLETITRGKIRRVIKAASDYLERRLQSDPGTWPPMRFDAVGIVLSEPPKITLVKEAFEASYPWI